MSGLKGGSKHKQSKPPFGRSAGISLPALMRQAETRKEELMARKSYNRRFRKCHRSFLVQNCFKQDMKKPTDRYYLTMLKDGWYRIVHDFRGNVPKFSTIREAHDYAWSCGEFIDEQVR